MALLLLLLLYIIKNKLILLCTYFCFAFVWRPCMAINVSVQHNGGSLPGIILLKRCYY